MDLTLVQLQKEGEASLSYKIVKRKQCQHCIGGH